MSIFDSIWAANAVGIYNWWVLRSGVEVTPSYSRVGSTAVSRASISGASDPEAAIEVVIPHWDNEASANLEIYLDGAPAEPANYRATDYGVKVKVGAAASVTVVVTPTLAGTITNNATLTHAELDPNMSDNTALESIWVNNPLADITVYLPIILHH